MQRVLATKLFLPPPTATFVARQRLLDRLRDVLRHPLTVVITPAGYGKTTLVSTCAANAVADGAASVTWLTLDPHDDDVA